MFSLRRLRQANNCTLGQWTTNSQVALAVAAQPTGPYTRLQTIVKPWAHNPQMVRLPDGTYVVFTLGNGNGPQNGAQKNCVADSEGKEALPLPSTTDERGVAATRPEMPPVISAANVTVNFTLHYSRDLKTWTAKQAFIPDFPAIDSMGNWNPAPVVMPDGRLRVMVHTDPAPWAGEMIVEAETFEGPYVPLTGDITTCDHCEEGEQCRAPMKGSFDPRRTHWLTSMLAHSCVRHLQLTFILHAFLILTRHALTPCTGSRVYCLLLDPFMWTDARGNWHVLYHRMFDPAGRGPVPSPGWPGGHAFSRDGLQWSNISRCYTTGVELENGQYFETLRRERPKLLFNAAKQPTHLFNGVITENHGVYTMVAPLDLD